MDKKIMIGLLVLVLSGCNAVLYEVTEETVQEEDIDFKEAGASQAKEDGQVTMPEKKDSPPVLEGYQLIGLMEDRQAIFVKEMDAYFSRPRVSDIVLMDPVTKRVEEVAQGQLSVPEISPDKTRFIFVENVGFEQAGKIRIYDQGLTSISSPDLLAIENKGRTVKEATWQSSDHILLILGYKEGTITQGGDLYKMVLSTGTMTLLVDAKENREITLVEQVEAGTQYEVVGWTDENYTDYYYESKLVDFSTYQGALPIQEEEIDR